jgi:hypothetical protein
VTKDVTNHLIERCVMTSCIEPLHVSHLDSPNFLNPDMSLARASSLFYFTNVTLHYDRGTIFRALHDFVFHNFMSHEFILHESYPWTINGPYISSIRQIRSNLHDFRFPEFPELLPLISRVANPQKNQIYGSSPSFDQRL